ncbi:MAG: aminotransferase class I/II-fold pyridoxal phosphate-dependent enzyme [Thermoplasmata archaeon]|nr:aminotransferase class I/II-fold pyridoxal phosphate-dependent enzyme [Thermoplasmata archaeon]
MTPSKPRDRPLAEKDRPVFDPLPEWTGVSTRLVHGARRPERNAGAVVPPIYQTSTFQYPASFSDAGPGGKVYHYPRVGNPTHEVAAELVRDLEGAEGARVFASGMGAMSATLLTLLRPGDEVVALQDLYGGSLELLSDLLPRMGVRVRWVSAEQANEPEAIVTPTTRVVVLESPTNPLLRVYDLARWGEVADRVGALTVVDNTFATPVNQRPLALGIDLVVHSGTKYLGGHSDLMAGAVAGPERLLARIDATHRVIGAVLDPFAAFLLTRGLRTLGVRMARHGENARAVHEAVQGHRNVRQVLFPGSSSATEEEIARRQMRGRGGMVSIEVKGGLPGAERFLRQLQLIEVAPSLGGVESLASLPVQTSHRYLTAAERASRGIGDGLVRLSLGIEETEDLVRDVRQALDAL